MSDALTDEERVAAVVLADSLRGIHAKSGPVAAINAFVENDPELPAGLSDEAIAGLAADFSIAAAAEFFKRSGYHLDDERLDVDVHFLSVRHFRKRTGRDPVGDEAVLLVAEIAWSELETSLVRLTSSGVAS